MQRVSRHRLATYVADELAKGGSHTELMQQTAAYLIQHRQQDQAELLIRDISEILATKHASVSAQVTSARPLTDDLRKTIVDYIKKTEDASQVEISESIDESLIGGVIIRTPSAEFDSSIRSQLRQLKSYKENKEKN